MAFLLRWMERASVRKRATDLAELRALIAPTSGVRLLDVGGGAGAATERFATGRAEDRRTRAGRPQGVPRSRGPPRELATRRFRRGAGRRGCRGIFRRGDEVMRSPPANATGTPQLYRPPRRHPG